MAGEATAARAVPSPGTNGSTEALSPIPAAVASILPKFFSQKLGPPASGSGSEGDIVRNLELELGSPYTDGILLTPVSYCLEWLEHAWPWHV